MRHLLTVIATVLANKKKLSEFIILSNNFLDRISSIEF